MHICRGNTNTFVILQTLVVQTGFLTWLYHRIWDLDLMSSLILRSFEWPSENTNYIKRAWFTRRLTCESVSYLSYLHRHLFFNGTERVINIVAPAFLFYCNRLMIMKDDDMASNLNGHFFLAWLNLICIFLRIKNNDNLNYLLRIKSLIILNKTYC